VTLNPEARALVSKLNKELGDEAIVLASDIKVARRYTTGSLSLDVSLGGGWPANHWVEVIGMESHGKTFVVLKTIAANQALDPNFTVFWIAAEHYDAEQAAALGVDNERVIVFPTQAMEAAYQAMLEAASSHAIDCIVLDSYPALIADEEAEKDMDEAVMAVGARLTGKFFRKAGSATRRSLVDPGERPILGIIINQYRDAIGQFSPRGTPKTSPGGKAKNYAFYVRVEVARDDWIREKIDGTEGQTVVGQTIKVKTIKNKSAPGQQVASIDLFFADAPAHGFKRGDYNDAKDYFIPARLYNVIERRGNSYWFGGNKWVGKDAMQQALLEDLDLRAAVRVATLDAITREHREVTEEDVAAIENTGTRTVKRKAEAASEDSA
jgi:recombination protein RecA